jgi:hypothetical protein
MIEGNREYNLDFAKCVNNMACLEDKEGKQRTQSSIVSRFWILFKHNVSKYL